MSRRRQGVLFSRYSELPSRYTQRVTRTSCHSIPSSSAQSVNVSETSANPTGLRVSAPLKMTSAISSPLSDFADCSPSAHRTASRTLDFPHPFGPTTAVMPSWKFRIVLSANDLKPSSSSDCKCILGQNLGPRQPQYSKVSGVTSKKTPFMGFRNAPATGYWALRACCLLRGISNRRSRLRAFLASPLRQRKEDKGEGLGQLAASWDRSSPSSSPSPRERAPFTHARLQLPTIVKPPPLIRRP